MSAELNKTLCESFIGRAELQELKGKKRDTAAIEFMCGAIAALDAVGKVDEANHLAMVTAMLICTRGYDEVERIAKGEVK